MSYEYKSILDLDPSYELFQDADFMEAHVVGQDYSRRFSGAQIRGLEKQERITTDQMLAARIGLNSNYELKDLSQTNYLGPYVNVIHGLTILDAVAKNLQDQIDGLELTGGEWGQITGTLSDQLDLQLALDSKEPLIETSTTNKFLSWDKTWRQVDYSMLTGTAPTPDLSGYVTLGTSQTITGQKTFTSGTTTFKRDGVTGGINIYAPINGNYDGYIVATQNMTDHRTWQFPNKSGNVVLDTDLANYVTLNTAQYITGLKTFITGSSGTIGLAIRRDEYTSWFTIGVSGVSSASYTGDLKFPNIHANRVWTLPDDTGTIALQGWTNTQLGGYVTLASAQTITGIKTIGNAMGQLNFKYNNQGSNYRVVVTNNTASSYEGSLIFPALTATRSWSLPNNSGTIALTTDIPTTLPVLWGAITGTLSNQTDLQTALNNREPILPTNGTATQFLAGDKTFKTVPYSSLSGLPTLNPSRWTDLYNHDGTVFQGINRNGVVSIGGFNASFTPPTGYNGLNINTGINANTSVGGSPFSIYSSDSIALFRLNTIGDGFIRNRLYIGNTTGLSAKPYISLYNLTGGYTNIVTPDGTATVSFVFPPSNGSANQVLKTDGSGNTSWSTLPSFDTIDVFTTTVDGLVPAPGESTGSKFLCDDGTWKITGTQGVTTQLRVGTGTYYSGDLTLIQGSGISLSSNASKEFTIAHGSISAASSVNNSGYTVLQDIGFDSFGHVTSISSTTIPNFSNNTAGFVPAPNLSGIDIGTKYLRDDGVWAVPPTGDAGVTLHVDSINYITLTGSQLRSYPVNLSSHVTGSLALTSLANYPNTTSKYLSGQGWSTFPDFEPPIPTGTITHYWAGNKTFKQIAYSEISGTPEAPDLSDYVTLATTQTITGQKTFSNTNGIYILNGTTLQILPAVGSNTGIITNASLSLNRTWTLPNASGTFALTSDIVPTDLTNYVTLNTSQTISGNKIFSSNAGVYFQNGAILQILPAGAVQSGQITNVSLTGPRVWTLPDTSGTFAMISDITTPDLSNYVTLSTTQSISGAKTFQQLANFPSIGLNYSSSYKTVIQSGTLNSNTLFQLPINNGSSGQVLTTNGSGITSWGDMSSSKWTDVSGVGISREGNVLIGTYSSQTLASGGKGLFVLGISESSAVRSLLFLSSNNRALMQMTNRGALSLYQGLYIGSPSETDTNFRPFIYMRSLYSDYSVKLQTVDSLASNYTLTLPATAGTNGYVLTTNGSGTLSWSPNGAGNYTVFTLNTNGLVPGPTVQNATTFLASDGNWYTVNAGITTSLKVSGGTPRVGDLTIVGTDGVTVANTSELVFTISHSDTSSVSDISTSGYDVISAVTFDTKGHVQTVSSRSILPASSTGLYLRDDGWFALPEGTEHDAVTLDTGDRYITLTDQRLNIGLISVGWINATGRTDTTFLRGDGTWATTPTSNPYTWNLEAGVDLGIPIENGNAVTFIGSGSTTVERSGKTIIISSTAPGEGIGEVPATLNTLWLRARDGSSNTYWSLYTAPSTHDPITLDNSVASFITLSGQALTTTKISMAHLNTAGNPSALTFLNGLGNWETPPGTSYTFPTSVANASGSVTLVNDNANPGDSMYYGTNSSGTKGWFELPEGSNPTPHPPYTAISATLTGATVLSTFKSDTIGSVTELTTRTLSYSDIGAAPISHTHDDRYYTETEINANYYTQTQINAFFAGSTAIFGYNKATWDTAAGWGNHAIAGYMSSVSVDGGITRTGTATAAVLKIVSMNTPGVGQVTVGTSTLGVTLGTTNTTAAAGNHDHGGILHQRKHSMASSDDHYAGNYKVFYSGAAGVVYELSLGSADKVFTSNGVTSAPIFKSFYEFDKFDYTKKGLVPIPSSLLFGAPETRFLCADGNWAIPTGTGSGMSNPMQNVGDMIYRSSTQNPAALAIGTVGQVLAVSSALEPHWVTLDSTFMMNITGDIVAGSNQVSVLQDRAISQRTPITTLEAEDMFLVSQDLGLVSLTAGNLQSFIIPFHNKGEILYGGTSGAITVLSPNTSATLKFLSQSSSNTGWSDYSFNNLIGVTPYSTTHIGKLVRVNQSGDGLEYMAMNTATTSALRVVGTTLNAQLQNEANPILGGHLSGNSQWSLFNVTHLLPALAPVTNAIANDLGSATYRWRVGYIDKLVTNEHIWLGGPSGGVYYAGNQNGDAKFKDVSATKVITTLIEFGTNKFAIRYNGGGLQFLFGGVVKAEMLDDGNMVFIKT